MRFHCGFSFNWKTIKKWIIPILIGVLLLFSQKLNVYAFDIGQYKPVSQDLVWSSAQSQSWSFLSDGMQGSNFTFDSSYLVQNDLLIFPFSSGFTIQSQTTTPDYYYTWYKEVENFIVYAMTNDAIGYIPCQVEEGMIICSAKGYTITGINVRFRNNFQGLPIYGTAQAIGNYLWIQLDQRVHTFDFINSSQIIIDNNNQNTQDIIDSQNDINDSINGLNDSINDSSLGNGSSGSAYFGDNIWEKNYGLSSLLTIPLDLVNSITTKTCSNLVLDLPFLNNKTITLPCISTIIQSNFQQLFDLYQIIIGGIICYNCALHIYRDVENALDPESNMSIAGYFV